MIARLAALCLALTLWLAGPVAAQETPAPGAPSANDLHEFTRLLADPRIRDWIAAKATEAELVEPVTVSAREELVAFRARVRARVENLIAARQAAPGAFDYFIGIWRGQLPPAAQLRGLSLVMIFLFVGAGLEWLYRQYTDTARLRIELREVEHLSQRIAAAALRAVIAFAGLAIFALGSFGSFAAFDWPPLLEILVLNLLGLIVGVRVISTVLMFFLAPRVEELRLLPLGNRLARGLARLLLALTTVVMVTVFVSDVSTRVSALAAGGAFVPEALAVRCILALVCLVATVIAIWLGFRMAAPGGLNRRLKIWRFYLAALAVLVFLTVTLGLTQATWTLALLGLLVPGLVLLKAWVNRSFDGAEAEFRARLQAAAPPAETATEGETAEPDVEPAAALNPHETYRPIAHRLARFAIVVLVGIALAFIWDVGLLQLRDSPTFFGRLVSVLVDSAVALLIADLIWTWARTAIDRRLAAYKPPEPGTAPGPEARMATLLPLLRMALMVTLLAMVSMSVLSSMGVNIAPIIAGAGVVGIAIGFGAQSLVKDVVSGVFFLIDDAFRVGEYVEIDQLRGTVERISLRSLQIRHHRGALHTLPFGEMRSLTNHSRDWVIMKLEFRVPFDTDLKLVKKLIKNIGEQLKQNEFYGDGIIETLKSQGVRRMEEFNMVVGVKFMTRPGEQWLVRRDAYQMVRDAFDANGIRMAERNVKVEVAGGEHLSDEARKAVTAVAQEATETRLPPGPVPDEP